MYSLTEITQQTLIEVKALDKKFGAIHAVKNLSTGEGGAISLNLSEPFDNQQIYNYLSVFCMHGQSKDALTK